MGLPLHNLQNQHKYGDWLISLKYVLNLFFKIRIFVSLLMLCTMKVNGKLPSVTRKRTAPRNSRFGHSGAWSRHRSAPGDVMLGGGNELNPRKNMFGGGVTETHAETIRDDVNVRWTEFVVTLCFSLFYTRKS